jgi:hypothetical protein
MRQLARVEGKRRKGKKKSMKPRGGLQRQIIMKRSEREKKEKTREGKGTAAAIPQKRMGTLLK